MFAASKVKSQQSTVPGGNEQRTNHNEVGALLRY